MSGEARRQAACDGTAGAILAGGRSRRMGRPKAFIELQGRPLITRVAEVLRALFPEVFIVSAEAAPFAGLGLPVIPDLHAEGGPLAGAHAALAATRQSRLLVVGCDMPFLNPALLAHLAGRAEGRGAAVPRGPDGLHPLHAVYTKGALEPMDAALARGALKFADVLSSLDVLEIGEEELRRFDPDLRSLFNVNRPEDLSRAETMIAAGRAPAPPAG